MKTLKLWFAVLVMLPVFAMAQEQQDPYALLQAVASKTFEEIKQRQPEIKENPEVLKDIVEQQLLPYVDYKFAGAKVLGKHFKSVSRDKIPVFFEEFRKYLISTYAIALAQYDDQEVEFEPARDFANKKAVTVRVLVKEEGRPDIKIAFKVRKSRKTNEWKAWDMEAEGISMLSSKRSEFEAILRQEGVDKVIALLKEKNNETISLGTDANEA